ALAGRKAWVRRRDDGAREIDSADANGAQQDPPLASRGERVLVIDRGVRHPHHHFPRIQLIQAALNEAGLSLSPLIVNAKSFELFHGAQATHVRSGRLRRCCGWCATAYNSGKCRVAYPQVTSRTGVASSG